AKILDRTNLGSSGYKTFAPARAGTARRAAPAESPALEPVLPSAPEPVEPRPTGLRRTAPRPVLETASRLLARASAGERREARLDWAALPAGRCVAVAAVSRGVGASTVLANAAALLAAEGERVTVAD